MVAPLLYPINSKLFKLNQTSLPPPPLYLIISGLIFYDFSNDLSSICSDIIVTLAF